MKVKSTFLAAVAVAGALMAAGCGSSGDDGGSGGGGSRAIGVAVADLGAPFFNAIRLGAESVGKEKGYDVSVEDAQGDAQRQVDQVQGFITKQVGAIVYVPAGAAAASVPVEAANDADIPVIAVDRKPDGGDVLTFIASDSVAAARTLGEWYARQVDGRGDLAVLQGQIGTTPENDRKRGFDEGIAGSEIRIVAQQAANWNQEQGHRAAQTILQAHPDLRGFFGRSDAMALGAAEAASQAGVRDRLVIVGFDGLPAGLQGVKNGDLDATMVQQAYKMGRLAAENAIAAIEGRADGIPAEQLQEAFLATRENVDRYIAEQPYGPQKP
jgi:ribose transport system substrate-binding protein